jgi:hypothetical protein
MAKSAHPPIPAGALQKWLRERIWYEVHPQEDFGIPQAVFRQRILAAGSSAGFATKTYAFSDGLVQFCFFEKHRTGYPEHTY